MNYINNNIFLLRKNLNLTQQEFADKIGAKRSTVASYETGQNTPSEAVLSSICRTFGVNKDWLLKNEGDMYVSNNRANRISYWIGQTLNNEKTEFQERFLHILSKLTPEQWAVLADMCKMMAEEFVDETK